LQNKFTDFFTNSEQIFIRLVCCRNLCPLFFGNTIQEIDLVQFLFEILFSFSFLPMDCNFKCIQSMSRKVWAENNPPDDQRAFNQRQPLARARLSMQIGKFVGTRQKQFPQPVCMLCMYLTHISPLRGVGGLGVLLEESARAEGAQCIVVCVLLAHNRALLSTF
jgi:hypothetical protein